MPRLSDAPVGTLVPMPHGGALRNGGWNSGGSGPAPSALRARLRGSFANRVAIAEDIATDVTQTATDRLRAIDLLAKYAGISGLGADDGSGALVIRVERVTPDDE
jgi:hypothetical protein